MKKAVLFLLCIAAGISAVNAARRYVKHNDPDAFCGPSDEMSSNNVADAKKECDRNPSCHSFYQVSEVYFHACKKGYWVRTGYGVSNLYEPIISCASWPRSIGFGCSEGEWKSLDSSLDRSDQARCEALCLKQNENGCCYLRNDIGCYWVPGGEAAGGDTCNGKAGSCTGIAVTCE